MNVLKSLRIPERPEDLASTVGDQGNHLDENPEDVQEMLPENMPLSVIVAVSPRTRLRIRLLGSQTWVQVLLERTGDVLIFRGDVCHCGVGYTDLNVRVHFHLYKVGYFPGEANLHQCV